MRKKIKIQVQLEKILDYIVLIDNLSSKTETHQYPCTT